MQNDRYDPSRGGHAPGHARDYFAELVERGEAPDHPADLSPDSVVGLLWNCTDTMPSEVCGLLDLPPGRSYASGVRQWRMLSAAV